MSSHCTTLSYLAPLGRAADAPDPNRNLLASSLHSGTVQIWDFQMGTLVDRFDEHDGGCSVQTQGHHDDRTMGSAARLELTVQDLSVVSRSTPLSPFW